MIFISCNISIRIFRNISWCVDEGVPDAGPAATGRRHALHLVRRRRRPEHEPLGERRPAQPARVRPHGTDAEPVATKRHEGQGQQQQLQPAAMRRQCRSRRGAHHSSSVASGSGSSAAASPYSRTLTV
uniref:Uncharacterized protein n=1 Tax=Arundo donax TaxID=35708 RepID=A0A0A8YC22_ARUDO